MAYRFRRGESVCEGIRRVAAEEAASAVRNLSAKTRQLAPEAIHETRKSLKKLRALLRLVRGEIGGSYAELNRTFRDIGHQLSVYRDAEALLEAFDKLRPALREVPGPSLAAFRRELAARKRQMQRNAALGKRKAHLSGVFEATIADLGKLPIHTEGYAAIEEGFEECYRRGRKALSRAEKRASPENLHELRKRVKDHWYHVRLLEQVWKAMMPPYEATLKQMETALGEDHNLVLLGAAAAKTPDGKLLVRGINRVRKTLQAEALAAGRRVYERKPRAIAREFERLWNIWRSEPKFLNHIPAANAVTDGASTPDPIDTAVERASATNAAGQ
jgi:CHAD domain-containing protein